MIKTGSRTRKLSPGKKAKRTGQWAKIMAKWLISFSTKDKKRWQIVSFEGPSGGESKGIIDLVAIRKDFRSCDKILKIGDKFEIILIQVKGGNSKLPNDHDIKRLREVKKYYHAKTVLLAVWNKGRVPAIYKLLNTDWKQADVNDVFN